MLFRKLSSLRLPTALIGAPLVLLGTAVPAHAAARPGPSVPSAWVTEQVNFVIGHQLPDGAIISTPGKINPYFANIAAMGLARANTPTSRAALRAWMNWYFAHLNKPDASGLTDTVYDYTYDPATETEKSTGDYDSVDSYASTTLNVAYLAYQTGNNGLRAFVRNHIRTYEAIADLDDYPSGGGGVRDSNNLTFAKPTYHADYLMDNAEVYGGLTDFAALESALGRTSQASYYGAWAATTKSAITSLLWNASTSTWDWALDMQANLGRFYPDAAAQLWPVIWGVTAPGDAKSVSAWSNFTAAWPGWMHDTEPDGYPWTVMASAAQRMGDTAGAGTLLTTIRGNYAPGWVLPTSCGASTCGQWYDAEAGWFLLGALNKTP